MTLRVPPTEIPTVLRLSHRYLRIGHELFQLGEPTLRALEPCPRLFARQVAIRLTRPPKGTDGALDMDAFVNAFRAEAIRQLATLEVHAQLSVLAKRSLSVKEQRIIAFSVEVDGLRPEDSIRLQARGIGGKRRMGCGVFEVSRRRVEAES